jgi:hypothetical protein
MSEKEKKPIFKRWWFWVLVVVVIGAVAGGGNEGGSKSSSDRSTTNSAAAKPDPVLANRPADQTAFIEAVERGQAGAKSAANDMQKGGAKAARDKEICAALKGMVVRDWTGTLTTIDSNSDGKGVVSIRIANDVYVKTWNNALSDIGTNTLLEPGSSLFNKISGFKTRTKVKFSGNFFNSNEDCIKESSLSLDGKLKKPEFIFKFTDVSEL